MEWGGRKQAYEISQPDDDAMATYDEKQQRLDTTLDKLRARYGHSVVYFGGVHDAHRCASASPTFRMSGWRIEGYGGKFSD